MLVRRAVFVSCMVLAPLAILACASILGIQDGKPYPDASTDAIAEVFQSKDVLVIDGNFAECDGEAPRTLQQGGIFVDGNKGNDDGVCGTIVAPCKTINFALGKTDSNHKFVYVATGMYTESIVLKSDVSVQGGWEILDDGGWSPVCRTDRVSLTADQPGAAITADNVQNASVGYMTVYTFHDGVPGGSLYGVYANESKLELVNVVAVSQNGGDGTTGDPGSLGGMNCPGSGGNGGTGGNGGMGTGSFSQQGYAPVGGNYGDPGNEGQQGGAGGMGDCTSACVTCTMTFGNFDADVPEGGCSKTVASPTCGDQGNPGCAGAGGGGGGPGLGGGASIALYAWGASTVVTIRGGLFATVLGGSGGDGGVGGSGGSPSAGTPGNVQSCATDCDMACMPSVYVTVDGGSGGSPGTKGGNGGLGGGGAGGPTYLILMGGGAQVTGAPPFMLGKAGVGGAPNGPPGEATQTKTAP